MSTTDKIRYVIVGLARSGTTAAHNAVFGHPNVCAMADEFRVDPFFTKGVACFTVGGNNTWERKINYNALFDAVTKYPSGNPDPAGKRLIAYNGTPSVRKKENLAHGLKVAIPSATDAKNLVDSLQEFFPQMRIIHVRRADWVAQFASLARAKNTGVWHTREENPAASQPGEKMTLSPKEFSAYLAMATEVEQQLQRLHESHAVCEFSYEQDLLPNDPSTAHRVFEFLGLEAMDPTWMRLTKTAPPLEEFVANVDELRAIMTAHCS
ncbi:MAG: LPS sulfotransferase NodH [Planctomycetota bacterium]|jgi:LPS sulfotransferase NodH